MAQRLLWQFPALQAHAEADDIAQQATLRLLHALEEIMPRTVAEYCGLVILQIRRELLDQMRHYFGQEGAGRREVRAIAVGAETDGQNTIYNQLGTRDAELQDGFWQDVHATIDNLPTAERQAFELIWYQELTQAAAAEVMRVSERQLKRYWQSARQKMAFALREHVTRN
ncbi:MAG: sigma-70 family RNA polymerase sigma factor [Pirellulales bacterium]|nr:sigma-70 family RNA polymerase sigma factor [Pirellulales bacterium]